MRSSLSINQSIKTDNRIRRPLHEIVTLPLLGRDILLLQLTHMRETRAFADLLDELVD